MLSSFLASVRLARFQFISTGSRIQSCRSFDPVQQHAKKQAVWLPCDILHIRDVTHKHHCFNQEFAVCFWAGLGWTGLHSEGNMNYLREVWCLETLPKLLQEYDSEHAIACTLFDPLERAGSLASQDLYQWHMPIELAQHSWRWGWADPYAMTVRLQVWLALCSLDLVTILQYSWNLVLALR